jgi:hypothetical protein
MVHSAQISDLGSGIPTPTGTGASGSWGISITGNAATATTATNQSGGTVSATSGTFSGNVGIGTTSPSAKLHINTGATEGAVFAKYETTGNGYGGIEFRGTRGSGSNGSTVGQIQSYWQNSARGGIIFNDGGDISILPTRNVGIGTASPGYKLHVSGTSQFEAEMRWSLGTTVSHAGYSTNKDWYIRSGETAGKVILQDIGGNVGIGTNSPGYKLDVNGTVNTGALTATTGTFSGNVGIGTASPITKFEVSDLSVFNVDVSDATCVKVGNRYSSADQLSLIGAGDIAICSDWNDNDTGKNIDFRTNTDTNGGTLLMRIQDDGNVGIGTDSPQEKLHLVGDDANPLFLKMVGNTSKRAGIILSEDAGNHIIMEYDGTGTGAGNYFSMYSGVSGWASKGSGLNFVPSTGNIGIGTTSPGYKLDVSGTARFTGTVTAPTFSGNAATATKLATARAINGVNFDGLAAITVNGTNYNVNNSWFRELGDNAHFKQYGNSRQMVFRTDGTTEYASGIGAYPFVWMYGGDASSNRRMMLNTSGQLWCSNYGWLHDKFMARTQVFSDTDANAGFNGQTIDYNASGSQTTTADRVHRALFIDMDSSATGGDTNHEHRMYGIYNDVRHSGDSDLVYGMYSYTRSDHTSGTTTNLRAGDFIAQASGTGTNTNVYGINSFAHKDGGSTGATTTMYGIKSEVQVDAGTVTNAYSYHAHIDRNGGTLTNGYLYYGSYAGTVGTKWGLYLTGETKNYFSGSVGIGQSSPGYKLDVNGTLHAGNSYFDTVYIGGSTSRGLRSVSGNYGTVQTTGGGAGNWEGYSIDGRYVFMSKDNNTCGIYNDIDNEWMIYCYRNSYTKLYYNGAEKLETTNTGVTITGTVTATTGTFSGAISQNGKELYAQKRWDIDLTSQSSTNFYPVEFSVPTEQETTWGDVHPVHFKVYGESLGGGDPYNENTLVGYARGGGWSDHPEMYDVHISRFTGGENRFEGLYKGTQSYSYGIVIYMRGGYKYSTITDATTVNVYTVATTITNSVFAIKNSSGGDVSGTSSNISRMVNIAASTQGDQRWMSGTVTAPTFSGNATTASYATSASSVTGQSSIAKTAHTFGANDYHLELASGYTGDASTEISLRFHQSNLYWGTLGYNNLGFSFRDGASTTLSAVRVGSLYSSGTIESDGRIYADNGCHVRTDWLRVNGNNGIYFESYGGGWRMTDTTYVRVYNDKTIYTGGHILAGGNVTAYSDIRHKKDLIKLNNALEKVEKLNGYTYTSKRDDKRYTGLVAQEVLEVLPEAVNEEDGGYSLAYGNMAGLFVEAIKDMKSKLDDALARLSALENTLS